MLTTTIPSSKRSLLLTPERRARIFQLLNLKVLPFQAQIHRSSSRFRLVNGGRRVGKSVMGGREAAIQLIIPESYVWIVGPTMDLAEKEFRVAWKIIVEGGAVPVRRKSERELFIQCENGSYL